MSTNSHQPAPWSLRHVGRNATVKSGAAACAVVLLLLATTVKSTGRQVLIGHVPPAVKDGSLQPVDRLSATQHLHLAIGLPLRDPDTARAFVQKLYDPTSPSFHQYLTPEQFTEKFGPTEQDYAAVAAFASANGFQVMETHPNRLVLDVEATAGDVEKAFQVRLFEYQQPKEARKFYAPDVEPSVPSDVKIVDISGLNNYARPHPNSHRGEATQQSSEPTPSAGSMAGQYIGNDFRAAYVPGTLLTGLGQSVALVQFDGYYASDITRYESLAGLPAVTLTNILLDGFSGTPTTGTLSGNGEVSLDIEMVNAMAPGISRLFVYEGNPNDFIPNDVLSRIASDDAANQISCSWTWTGGPTTTTDSVFIQMATQGQSFFVASGDSDAYPGSTADSTSKYGTPSQSPYVTSVGGTTLSTSGPTNNWVSETVWNWGVEYGTSYNGVGSSGGYSADYAIPTWQQGVSTNNLGSAAGRNFPDVALTADHVFVAYGSGTTNWFGGTSCAAPLWAAFTALVNQQGAAFGKSAVGFLNPALYAIGTGTSCSTCFHDITTGNNEWSNSPSAYTALTGYDLCTGWGTPTGTNLINALVGPLTDACLVLTGSIISGGNSNGVIDADECNQLYLSVENIGIVTAATINATLFTSTAGVTITQPFSTYANLAPGTIGTNTVPFQVSASSNFVCGTSVSLSFVLSYNGVSTTNVLTLPTCTSCTAFHYTGNLSSSAPTQSNEVNYDGTPTTCSATTTCPGIFAEGSVAYRAYSFTNASSSSVCVSVTVSNACGYPYYISSTAYLGSFTPGSVCANYLADIGYIFYSKALSYSFNVPANTNFTVVVNAVFAGYNCSNFSLAVSGLPCYVDGGGSCVGVLASFSGTPTNGAAPLTVTFTDTSAGSITNRFWNFGDGATTNVTTSTVTYTYNSTGVYTVAEIVTGPAGSSTSTQSNYITVSLPPPLAGFSATPTNGAVPLIVTFTDTSTGAITNRFWDFGDGGTKNATTNSVAYIYDATGVYTVTEIVSGPGGSSTNAQSNCIAVWTPFQAWQIQYFNGTNNASAAAGADADGTGQNNSFKYVAGLDPTNPSSVFLLAISTVTNQPADLELQFFPMANGRIYTPQFSTDLVGGVWLPLTTYIGPATNGDRISVTDTNPLPPGEFYRIEISLP
ncbi:MAG TPA: protease pro-enzyme activation domain-containing protein [Verrucomicrobiae bacterium]|nr:protease pro-enzyme activation domain-containing protein [Verrucomicrobiae bacterium]